jgi:superfamily II RNA helicase
MNDLTLRGVLATEINEAHSLVTAEIYASGLLKDESAENILTLLASFINEKMDSDTKLRISDLQISEEIRNRLYDIGDVIEKFYGMERKYNIPDGTYWDLNVNWIEPISRWIQGENSAVICADYGIYEGNLMRTILRMANIADEWINIATYCEHTEMVDRVTAAKATLLREIAITDSLYLRI